MNARPNHELHEFHEGSRPGSWNSRNSWFVGLACLAALVVVPAVGADNCSGPADCEQTADYNNGISIGGGIVAVIIATTVAGFAPPGTGAVLGPGFGAGGGPPRDPYGGGPLTTNDGRWPDVPKGHVWWPWDGGGWRSPADVNERIRQIQEAQQKEREHIAREEDYNKRKRKEFEESSWDATQKLGDKRRQEALDEQEAIRREQEELIKRRRREELLDQQQENFKDQKRHEGWGVVKEEFWDKTTKEIDELPGDVQKLGRDLVRGGFKAAEDVAKGLVDPENWRIAAETVGGTAWDAVTGPPKLLAGDKRTWDNVVNAVDTVGKVGGHVVNEIKKDPVGFVKGLTPIKAWEDAMDPNKPLIERIGRTWWATVDTAISVGGVGKVLGKGGAKAVESVADDIADAAKAALRDKKLPPKVSPEKLKELNEAWDRQRAASRKKVFDYETKNRELDDAIKLGNQKEIDRAIQAKRDAAIKLQGDKVALQEINRGKQSTIKNFNRDMKQVYGNTDDEMVKWARDRANKQGKDYGDMKPAGTNSDGARVFRDDKGNEIHIAEPTNPTGGKVKAGADRDYTMRTLDRSELKPGIEGPSRAGRQATDIPAAEVQKQYNDEFFKAAGGKDMANRTGMPDDPSKFTHKMDQVGTDRLHPEAYGANKKDLETALSRPDRAFSDPTQVGKAVEFKGQHWYQEGNVFEGSRQTMKQFDNQAMGRFKAMDKHVTDLQAEGKLSKDFVVKPPPPAVSEGVEIMRKVHQPNGISPAQAVEDLRKIGMTPEDVSRGVGDYVDSLQRSAPPVLRQRMGG